ncbi:DUF4174 domain-containing protein [Dinoroseobacter sp. S124A]|uniref:DUF4174 domain-containing protein n=1 Tax=Dinoroseobacter sp. S124A TaxID=3415128 RepID=UPI003C7ED3EC
MKRLIPLVFAGLIASTGGVAANDDAAETLAPLQADEINLNDFLWVARPIVVFADTPADPRFIEQMTLLAARPKDLAERDVVVIVDTDPSARSELRQTLRPRGYMMALVGKDGGVKLRKPSPWSVREITRQIDKMPLRQDEIRLKKAVGG